MKQTNRTKHASFLMYTVAASALLAPGLSYAINIDPNLAVGNATITQNGNITNVNQTTNKAIYNASSLDTTAAETLKVNTPDIKSIGLFKVSGATTKFDGTLTSNGQVWIVNPNGAVFGSTANVNVGGLLVSTANISNENFQNPINDGTSKRYIFDQAGNQQAAIVVKSGAKIFAKYPDGTFGVLLSEKGGEIGAGGSAPAGVLDAQDLTNWILTPGTTVDSKNKNDVDANGNNYWGYDNVIWDPKNHPQFFDLDGTNYDNTKTAAVLTSKKTFDLAPGQYTMNFDAAGNGRSNARDAMLIEVIDSNNKVLFSNTSTYNKDTAWTNTPLSFALDQPVTGLRVRITGQSLDLPQGTKTDNFGVSLGKFEMSYRPTENPYVTFMAPAIRQETGSHVEALNGAINYAAGTTFEASTINDKTVNKVKINDPVRMAAIIDGKQVTSPIEIQRGADLWAALVPDSPVGTVTIQSKVTQGVFDTAFDKNGNGINDRTETRGPLGQVYDASELNNIANGADIRPAPVRNGETGQTSDKGALTITAQIVPGAPVLPPVTPPAIAPAISQNQLTPPIADLTFAQISARDVVSRNFVNASDSVDPTISVGSGLSLSQASFASSGAPSAAALAQISPAAGGSNGAAHPGSDSTNHYAYMSPTAAGSGLVPVSPRYASDTVKTASASNAPANGGSAADYANLSPAAGGKSANGNSAASTDTAARDGQTACANESLDKIGFLQKERKECRRQPQI
jgi:filamentous hemagglutinin family protein